MNLYSVILTIAGSDLAPMQFAGPASSEDEAIAVAHYRALCEGVDDDLLGIADAQVFNISSLARNFVDTYPEEYEPTLFEKCVAAAEGEEGLVLRVIQTIIDNTGSPYTVDELTRILNEGDA